MEKEHAERELIDLKNDLSCKNIELARWAPPHIHTHLSSPTLPHSMIYGRLEKSCSACILKLKSYEQPGLHLLEEKNLYLVHENVSLGQHRLSTVPTFLLNRGSLLVTSSAKNYLPLTFHADKADELKREPEDEAGRAGGGQRRARQDRHWGQARRASQREGRLR